MFIAKIKTQTKVNVITDSSANYAEINNKAMMSKEKELE